MSNAKNYYYKFEKENFAEAVNYLHNLQEKMNFKIANYDIEVMCNNFDVFRDLILKLDDKSTFDEPRKVKQLFRLDRKQFDKYSKIIANFKNYTDLEIEFTWQFSEVNGVTYFNNTNFELFKQEKSDELYFILSFDPKFEDLYFDIQDVLKVEFEPGYPEISD